MNLRMSIFILATVVALVLSGIAAASACSTLRQHVPSLFVVPWGDYSILQMPSWGKPSRGETNDEDPLSPSHRIVQVAGEQMEIEQPARTQQELYQRIDHLSKSTSEVRLEFEALKFNFSERQFRSAGKNVLLTQTIRELGVDEVVFLFVIYALVAWLVLWSGAMVFVLCGRPAAGSAYLAWSVITFLFLLTFYDYHTRAWLPPIFSLSTVGLPISALWLAYSFPEPVRRHRELTRRVLVALTVLACAAALWLASSYVLGGDPRIVRRAVDMTINPSIGALGLSVIVRMRGTTGRERAELVTAIWGLLLTPAAIACIDIVQLLTDIDFLHMVLPFIVLPFPLSIGYSMIRTNILATSAVLTPRMLLVPLLTFGLLAAVLAGYGVHWALRSEGRQLVVVFVAGIVCFILVLAPARRAMLRLFFPASLQFRPTIESLTDRLVTLRDSTGVTQAVHAAVMQWLPVLGARILSPSALSEVDRIPPDSLERLTRGEHVWSGETPWNRQLLIPMTSLGELYGVLCVGPKRGAALYTQEDLALLETVASLGALALHHARNLEELDQLRNAEWEILSGEKQQALGALSAEICHEVVSPLGFIRELLRDVARKGSITDDDVQIGKKELGRLEGMIASLRTLTPPEPSLEQIAIAEPIDRAVRLIRDLVQQKRITVIVDVPPDLKLSAHADLAVQLFLNLLRNAAQAVRDGGTIGVRTFEMIGEDKVKRRLIEVWDNGGGIPEAVAKALFKRRITTKAETGGHGIGLSVAYRIANNFRWTLEFKPEADRTCFWVVVPAATVPPASQENA